LTTANITRTVPVPEGNSGAELYRNGAACV